MAAVGFFILWAIRRCRHHQHSDIVDPFPTSTYPFNNSGQMTSMRNATNDRSGITWGSRAFSSAGGDGSYSLSAQFSPTEIEHNLAGIGANPFAFYGGTPLRDPFGDYLANNLNTTTDRSQPHSTPNSAPSTPSFYLSSLAHIDGEGRDHFNALESCSMSPRMGHAQLPDSVTPPLEISAKKSKSDVFTVQRTHSPIICSRHTQICISSAQPRVTCPL
jgi:hypothetical protein